MSINDLDLDRLLRSVHVPEREAAFWAEFPGRVSRQLHRPQPLNQAAKVPSELRTRSSLSWKIACAAILILVGVGIGVGLKSWRESDSKALARQMEPMRLYLRELSALFPHQIRAVTFQDGEVRLTLAESGSVPDSSPIFLQVRTSTECQRHITFSGQAIQLNGERCEVLTDARGDVLVVGPDKVWSSAQPSNRFGACRISATVLGTS